MEECVKTIADGEEGEEETLELKYQLDVLKIQWNQFLDLEVKIEKKILDIEQKNVSGLEA